MSARDADNMDSFDSISPSILISYQSWQIFYTLNSVFTKLWNVSFFAGGPTLICPFVRIHRRKSLMSLSLVSLQYPVCLVNLIWMVCEIRGKWPYSCCYVRCCFQDLFQTAWEVLALN